MTIENLPAGTVHGTVGKDAVPASVLARGSVSPVDYADHFVLGTDRTAGPEQWARAMFGDVPSARARLIWSGLLGLRLSRRPSPDTVAGWRIGGRGEHWIRLEAPSWFLGANLLIEASDGRTSLTTLVRYDRPLARIIWTPLSAVHRRLLPRVLPTAADRLRAQETSTQETSTGSLSTP